MTAPRHPAAVPSTAAFDSVELARNYDGEEVVVLAFALGKDTRNVNRTVSAISPSG